MYLRDFADQRGVKPDTVAAYIREHEAEFAGCTWMEGKQKVLDDSAVELLDKKYPLPKPAYVVQDTEAREALAVALRDLAEARKIQGAIYEQLLAAKDENLKLTMQAAKVPLLEAAASNREDRIQEMAAALQAEQEDKMEAQAKQRAAEIEVDRLWEKLAAAEAELKAEKEKTWIQKLFGRK